MGDPEREEPPTVVERPGGSQPDRPSAVRLAAPPSAFDPPRDRFDKRGELGRGGMGRVDEAYDRALGRPVAIKHMLAPSSTDLARFEREARITARLEHPGIVPIHDAGRTEDGTPYYVMRRVDGQPLSEVAEGKTLDERLALVPNLLAASDAVAFAHARGIVHRDIKPTNILVGPFGETLLIDWGLAREISASADTESPAVMPSEPDLTRAGTVAGTPGFMAPEQARGESVDARADVFALGSTLFYVLAGRLPWHASGGTEMIEHVGANRPADWRLLPSEVPADLRAVLEKAMAPDPALRYPDAGALAADLRRFIAGNLVGAYTYGRMARIVRFIRRHRAAVAVAAASFVVVAVIATISVRRVLAERDDANVARALAERRQREATELADGLLVDNARQLADTDPVAAIAKLRRLSPTSSKWPEAWAAASAAYYHGVPFGFIGQYPGPGILRMDGTGKQMLALAAESGAIAVIDLIHRTRRVVAELGRIHDAEWLGSSIVAMATESVIVIDAATGQTRRLPIKARALLSNRTDRLLILTEDHRVLEITAADPMTPRELAQDVEDIEASWDLALIAIRRGLSVDVLAGDRRWTVERRHPGERTPLLYVTDGMLVVLENDAIDQWTMGVNGPEAGRTWPRETLLFALAIANKIVYQVDTNGVSIVDPKGFRTTVLRGSFQTVFTTPRGFVASDQDGRLAIIDPEGFFLMSPRPYAYRALDQTPDGRFLAAITKSGEVLVWDLQDLRGHAVDVDGTLTPLGLDATSLYAMNFGFHFGRVELETGTFTVLSRPAVPVVGRYYMDPEQRGVVLFTTNHDIAAYDIVRRRGVVLADGDGGAFAFETDGVSVGLRDGSIRRWVYGTDAPSPPIAKLDGEITSLATRPGRWLVTIASRRVVRGTAASTAHDQMTVSRDVIGTVLQPDGRAWIVTDDGAVLRWDVGAAEPVPFATPEPVDLLMPTATGVQMHSSKALISVDAIGRQRVTSIVSDQYYGMGSELAATATSTGNVNIVDLATGQHFELPQRVQDRMLIVGGKRVAVQIFTGAKGRRLVYWDLDIPREPARLQRWLETITNARPVPDSDAVAWPEN